MLRRREGEGPGLALGTMNFGGRTPSAEAEAIVGRALELGVRVFDTANLYEGGESERILGQSLRAVGAPGDARVATKVGLLRRKGKPEGLAPERVLAAIDESLERLGLSAVDVYYLHAPDPKTPIDETLSAVAEVLASGKARAFGVSNFASWQVLDVMHRCERHGMPGPAISQVLYNLLIREIEVEYAAFSRTFGLHTTVYNVLAGGLLTGRFSKGSPPVGSRFERNRMYVSRYWSDRFFELVAALGKVAEAHGMKLWELAHAFLFSSPHVDSILLGPADVPQLESAVAACRPLPEGAMRELDALHRAFAGTDTHYAR